MTKFDNVFQANIMEEFVELRVGHCDPELVQQPDGVPEDKVEDIRSIRISYSDYQYFLAIIATLGAELQKNHGIDMGFEIEEENND